MAWIWHHRGSFHSLPNLMRSALIAALHRHLSDYAGKSAIASFQMWCLSARMISDYVRKTVITVTKPRPSLVGAASHRSVESWKLSTMETGERIFLIIRWHLFTWGLLCTTVVVCNHDYSVWFPWKYQQDFNFHSEGSDHYYRLCVFTILKAYYLCWRLFFIKIN